MHNKYFIWLLLIGVSHLSGIVSEKERWVFCIDGGGSKTSLQIVDVQAPSKPVIFEKNGVMVTECTAGSSNINTIGIASLEQLFKELFDSIIVDGQPLAAIASSAKLVGGFAGLGVPSAIDSVTDLLKQWGFASVQIMSDVALVSQFIEHEGIVLIAGTGSICFAKFGEKSLRVGGLGKYLGDEGGGYYIGKLAIKAALECGYGYGEDTILVQDLCLHFNLQNIRDIVRPFYAGTITPQQVAALAPLVFERADSDPVAQLIIESAIEGLAQMLQIAAHKLAMKPSTIYLFGGVFKNNQRERFIARIIEKADLHGWNIQNMTFKHPVVALLAQGWESCGH